MDWCVSVLRLNKRVVTVWRQGHSLSVPWVLDEIAPAVPDLSSDPAQRRPVHLAHQPEILIAEVGRLEVPTQVICCLHQISLGGGGGGGGGACS